MHYSKLEANQLNAILKYAIEQKLPHIVDKRVNRDVLPNITLEDCVRLLKTIALKIPSAEFKTDNLSNLNSGGRYAIWINDDVREFYKQGGF